MIGNQYYLRPAMHPLPTLLITEQLTCKMIENAILHTQIDINTVNDSQIVETFRDIPQNISDPSNL